MCIHTKLRKKLHLFKLHFFSTHNMLLLSPLLTSTDWQNGGLYTETNAMLTYFSLFRCHARLKISLPNTATETAINQSDCRPTVDWCDHHSVQRTNYWKKTRPSWAHIGPSEIHGGQITNTTSYLLILSSFWYCFSSSFSLCSVLNRSSMYFNNSSIFSRFPSDIDTTIIFTDEQYDGH